MVEAPPEGAPEPGSLWRHWKLSSDRGEVLNYIVLAVARHSETEEWLVVYRAVYDGQTWVRPLDNWLDPPAIGVPRFSRLDGTT